MRPHLVPDTALGLGAASSLIKTFVGDVSHADLVRSSRTAPPIWISLVVTPPDKILIPLVANIVPHLVAGYAPLQAGANLAVTNAGGQALLTTVTDNATTGMTSLTQLLVDRDTQFTCGLQALSFESQFQTLGNGTPLGPNGLGLMLLNTDVSDLPVPLTGGDAANFLRVTLFYVEVDL